VHGAYILSVTFSVRFVLDEAQIETTPEGQLPAGDGWYILNLGETAWATVPGFGVWRDFDDPDRVPAPRPFGA
jgi:hypothetical protein